MLVLILLTLFLQCLITKHSWQYWSLSQHSCGHTKTALMPLSVLAHSSLNCKTHLGCDVFVVDVVIKRGRCPLKLMNSFSGNLRLLYSFISRLFLCCFLLPESIALGEIGLLKLSPSSSFALFRFRVCTPVSTFRCTAKYSHTSWTKSRCDFVLILSFGLVSLCLLCASTISLWRSHAFTRDWSIYHWIIGTIHRFLLVYISDTLCF